MLVILMVCFLLFSLQDEVAADFTSLTKTLYDLHKAQEPADYKGSPLAQLVVENFDEEQIWQELELQNNAVLKHFQNTAIEALSDETLTLLVEEDEEEEEEVETDDENVDEEEEEEEEAPRQAKTMVSKDRADDYTDEDSDLDFDVDALEKREKQKKVIGRKGSQTKVVPSEVDDKFFKLSEMESFLDDMDKREGKEDGKEGDVDYFQDLPSDEDDDLDLDQILSATKQKKNTVCILLLILTYFIVVMVQNTGNMWIIVYIDRQRAPGISSTRISLMLWMVNQLKQMTSQMARMTAWVKARKKVKKK